MAATPAVRHPAGTPLPTEKNEGPGPPESPGPRQSFEPGVPDADQAQLPAAKSSTIRWASSSWYWTGGDFMK